MDAYAFLIPSAGMNGVIPISEILAYATNFDLIGSKREFVKVIQAIDGFNYDQSKKKLDKNKKQQQQKQAMPPRRR